MYKAVLFSQRMKTLPRLTYQQIRLHLKHQDWSGECVHLPKTKKIVTDKTFLIQHIQKYNALIMARNISQFDTKVNDPALSLPCFQDGRPHQELNTHITYSSSVLLLASEDTSNSCHLVWRFNWSFTLFGAVTSY